MKNSLNFIINFSFLFNSGFKQPAVAVATVCRSVLAILRPSSADTWAECQAMMAGKNYPLSYSCFL